MAASVTKYVDPRNKLTPKIFRDTPRFGQELPFSYHLLTMRTDMSQQLLHLLFVTLLAIVCGITDRAKILLREIDIIWVTAVIRQYFIYVASQRLLHSENWHGSTFLQAAAAATMNRPPCCGGRPPCCIFIFSYIARYLT